MGTRFLPATKASAKEMMPVVDKPLIQYAVEEAVAAGMNEMIFITGRGKRAIEDHFDKATELEAELSQRGKNDLLQIVQEIIPRDVSCVYVRQPQALGLGHAVLCALPVVGEEPFAVVLADDLIDAQTPVLSQMTRIYGRAGVRYSPCRTSGARRPSATASCESTMIRIATPHRRHRREAAPAEGAFAWGSSGATSSRRASSITAAPDAGHRGRDSVDRCDCRAAHGRGRFRLRVRRRALRLRKQARLPQGESRFRDEARRDRCRFRAYLKSMGCQVPD
jgi:hypothetical protein